MRLYIPNIFDMIVGQYQISQKSQAKTNPEVGQTTGTAAEVLDITNVFEDFFIHEQQFIVTQIQMFELFKFVEDPGSEFLDVVVVKREMLKVCEMMEGRGSDGSDVVVTQWKGGQRIEAVKICINEMGDGVVAQIEAFQFR